MGIGWRQVGEGDGQRIAPTGGKGHFVTIGRRRRGRDDRGRRPRRIVERQVVISRAHGQVDGHGLAGHPVKGVHIYIRRVTERGGVGGAEGQGRCCAQRAVAHAGAVVTVHGATLLVTGHGHRHITQGQGELVLVSILQAVAHDDDGVIDPCATGVADVDPVIGQPIIVAEALVDAGRCLHDHPVVCGHFTQGRGHRLAVGHTHHVVIHIGGLAGGAVTERPVDFGCVRQSKRGRAAWCIVRFITIGQGARAGNRRSTADHQCRPWLCDVDDREGIRIQIAWPVVSAAELGNRCGAAAVEQGLVECCPAAVVERALERLHSHPAGIGRQAGDNGGCATAIGSGPEEASL